MCGKHPGSQQAKSGPALSNVRGMFCGVPPVTLRGKSYVHGTSPRLLKRKGDTTKLPQVAGAEWREGKVVRYKHRHARFGKLILLPVLHRGLFVSRLLSVHYNSHIQEGGELAKPVI